MSGPCKRSSCGGIVHTDSGGSPTQCPRECYRVGVVAHDAHNGCPGWMPDDGTHPEEPPTPTPLEEAQATVEDLRYRIRRACEALAEDEPLLAAELRRAERCPSCEHGWDIHSDDGCWYTVAIGRQGRNLVCACRVPALAKEAP